MFNSASPAWVQIDSTINSLDSVAIVLTACYGLFAAVQKFILKPFRMRSFLAGQWWGEIGDNCSMDLQCVLTLYVKDGELAGSLFYEGTNATNASIKGFDRLKNDSDHVKARRSKGFWPLVCDLYDITMSRDIHHDRSSLVDSASNGVSETYRYTFEITSRVRNPRLRCSVMTKADAHGEEHRLSGQLTRLPGG